MIIVAREKPPLVIVRRCPTRNHNGRMCAYPAGAGTGHKGWGVCRWHRGQWAAVEKTWRNAVDLAEEMDVTPLEALLYSVRTAAAHAAWTDLQLRAAIKAQDADPGEEPDSAVNKWLTESRRERTLFAKISKAAVDAGVAAALVQRIELEGNAVADAVTAALDILGLTPEDRFRALGAAQDRLLAIAGTGAPDDA